MRLVKNVVEHNVQVGDEVDTFGLMFRRRAVDGSYVAVPHGRLLVFQHRGVAVRNPCCDPSTINKVDPSYYGFRKLEGSQVCFRRELGAGNYLLLTDVESPQAARLSRCNRDGQVVAYCFLEDVP